MSNAGLCVHEYHDCLVGSWPRGAIRDVRSMIRKSEAAWRAAGDIDQWWFILRWTERKTEQGAFLERCCVYNSAPFKTRRACRLALTAYVQKFKGLSKG